MTIAKMQIQAQMNFIQQPPMFTQYEFEERPWNVLCILCGDHTRDTEQNLRKQGWLLKGETVFCPICNERV